jgi:hypothetical protein
LAFLSLQGKTCHYADISPSASAGYMCRYATYQRGGAKTQRLEKENKNYDPSQDRSLELTNAEAVAMAGVSEKSMVFMVWITLIAH